MVGHKFMYDRKTQKQRPFCFVDFCSDKALEQALVLDGRPFKRATINVNRAEFKSNRPGNHPFQALPLPGLTWLNSRKCDFGLTVQEH